MKQQQLSFDEALKELRSSDTPETRRLIAVAINVDQDTTVRRWFGKTNPTHPVGEYKIRLKVYLADKGWRITEFERLAPIVQRAVRLYAYQIIGIERLCEAFGYSGQNRATQMMQVLHGNHVPINERVRKAEPFIDSMQHALDDEMRKRVTSSSPKQSASISKPSSAASNNTVRQPRDDLIEVGARLVKALVPIAEYLASDNCSAEDRQRFRELAGGNGVFNVSTDFNRLTDQLNQLCSETIRRERLQSKGSK